MSSNTYSTELRPERRLRRAVILTGLVANLLGLLIILSATIALHWRVLASLFWLLLGARELLDISAGHKRIKWICLDCDGSVELITRQGDRLAATLLAGSIVLPTLAWLRLQAHDGRRYYELIHGNISQDEQWRRLQVIWRHLGAGG